MVGGRPLTSCFAVAWLVSENRLFFCDSVTPALLVNGNHLFICDSVAGLNTPFIIGADEGTARGVAIGTSKSIPRCLMLQSTSNSLAIGSR